MERCHSASRSCGRCCDPLPLTSSRLVRQLDPPAPDHPVLDSAARSDGLIGWLLVHGVHI